MRRRNPESKPAASVPVPQEKPSLAAEYLPMSSKTNSHEQPATAPVKFRREGPPSNPRLSKIEREELTTSNRAMYVGLPNSLKNRRALVLQKARKLVVGNARDGLVSTSYSGYSCVSVLYESTEARDKAVERMKNAFVKTEGQKIEVRAMPFGGQLRGGHGAIWTLKPGLIVTAASVAEAIGDFLKSPPDFQMRYIWQDGSPMDALYRT